MIAWLFFASIGWLVCALLLRGEVALAACFERSRRARLARFRAYRRGVL